VRGGLSQLEQAAEQLDVHGRSQLQTGELCLCEPSNIVVLVTAKVFGLSDPLLNQEQMVLRGPIPLWKGLFKNSNALETLWCHAEFLHEFAHECFLRSFAILTMTPKDVPGARIVVSIAAPAPEKDTVVLDQDST
jgi:hypothetical protein